MHNILDRGSTFKLLIKRYMKDLEDEINALEFMVMGARDPSQIQSLISYSEHLKRKIRMSKINLSKPLEAQLNYLESKCDTHCVQIENIMRPIERLHFVKSDRLESV